MLSCFESSDDVLFLCSVQGIQQKAMFLQTHCQDQLSRAKMIIQSVSDAHGLHGAQCLFMLVVVKKKRKISQIRIVL